MHLTYYATTPEVPEMKHNTYIAVNQMQFISARQHAEHAICYRPSVRLSVTQMDQSKTVEARIMQFSPYSSPIPLVFAG